MKQIETMLRKRIGLDPGSIGVTALHRNVRLRIGALGLSDIHTYTAVLMRSSREWRELTEPLLVTETWFYREPEAFDAATRLARTESTDTRPGGIWRVLSLPCSTGEEPYSLAMSLLDAGLSPTKFRIDAVDLSHRALEQARQGIYGPNSFRGKSLDFRDLHFHATRAGYELEKAVRDCAHFWQGNLLETKFFPGKQIYDCIFCRNLLIYFDHPVRRLVLRNLTTLLKDDGVLFVGAAEMPLVEDHGFESLGIPRAFACRKRRSPRVTPPQTGARTSRILNRPASPAAFARTELPSLARPVAGEAGAETPELAQAGRLIKSGRLVEATAICEELLRRSRVCAQAYYYLGLITDLSGGADAADFYRKALYLQPGHYDCLLRMAALAAKSGRQDQARHYHHRASRSNPDQNLQP